MPPSADPDHRPADGPDDRPRINPALVQLWRDARTLQIGLDPARAVVATGLDAVLRDFLRGLDGRHTAAELLRGAVGAGADPLIVRRLLAELRAANVLTDGAPQSLTSVGGPAEVDRLAPELASLSLLPGATPALRLRRRRGATVQVLGATRIGVPLASTVAASGVGRVAVLDEGNVVPADCVPGGLLPTDEHRPRRLAADDAVRRAAPATDCTSAARPDLVVLCEPWPDPAALSPLMARGIAHLVVTVREGTGVIGPLVRPGASSCVRCGDLHRTDRDPAWPAMLAQLTARRRTRIDPVDAALALLVAAVGAVQVLGHLDRGGEAPGTVDGASLEVSPPDWRLRRRSWPAHPLCGCSAASTGQTG